MVLDASILIAHVEAGDNHHGRATLALRALQGLPLGASPLTLAEVLVGALREGRVSVMRSQLRRLGVEEVPFGAEAPLRLAELRVQTGLRLPDCCVLLAAQDSGDEVLTFDRRLEAAADSLGL